MNGEIKVSVIIPTYHRCALAWRAIASVLAQTLTVDEIIVVDDGSTDGTGAALEAAFGDRIRYLWQANAGFSAARNSGLRAAHGRILTLLDSDDEWLPDKTACQLNWLNAHPDFGMVLCDVLCVNPNGDEIEIIHRRDAIPEDGDVLNWVLIQLALVPASLMMRHEVFKDAGEFDENLPTAEDLDFHLRVAAGWKIGIVDRVLVRAMRNGDGLSELKRIYDDYVTVIERSVAAAAGRVAQIDRRQALFRAYFRCTRGMIFFRQWAQA